MKYRILSKALLKASKTFPAIVVTGPRQSGKTTLLQTLFSKTHRFVSLEDPDIRLRAKDDPLGFLEENHPPVILDEIQYAPELLAYIKTKIDEDRKPGQWFFTGSQNFVLMQGISESLAGRVAVFSLLPFSYAERIGRGEKSENPEQWLKNLPSIKEGSYQPGSRLKEILLRGHYPEIAIQKAVDRGFWCRSYVTTYLERDVRNLTQVGDLSQFERFLKLCAIRTGQILNLSDLARDTGVSVPTAKRWLSILETGYLVYLLQPYYQNIGKRLIKSPKLYFCDTALASYLLGLHDEETLFNSPSFGPLFETFIVTDFLKRFLHFGQSAPLYFWRTRDGLEIDLVVELAQQFYCFEIKGGMTIVPKHADSLRRIRQEFPERVRNASVISLAPQNFLIGQNIYNYNWQKLLSS